MTPTPARVLERAVDCLTEAGRRAELGQQGGQRAGPAHLRASGRAGTARPRALTDWPSMPSEAVLSMHVRHLLMADVSVRRDLPGLRPPDAGRRPPTAQRPGHLRTPDGAIVTVGAQARGAQVAGQRARCDPRHRGHARAPRPARRAAVRRAGHRARPRRHRPAAQPAARRRPIECARGAAQRPSPTARRRPHVRCDRAARDRRCVHALHRGTPAARRPHLAPPAPMHRGARLDGPSPTWHAARIKAKRARYAAESVAPIFGKDMKQRFADRLADVTELLGRPSGRPRRPGASCGSWPAIPRRDGLTGLLARPAVRVRGRRGDHRPLPIRGAVAVGPAVRQEDAASPDPWRETTSSARPAWCWSVTTAASRSC